MRCWLFLVVVGCGGAASDPDPDPIDLPADTVQSGSRLKLSWFEFPDGFRTWATVQADMPEPQLFDAVIAEDCTAQRWSDTVTRCTPQFGRVYYEDAACTLPVLPFAESRFHIAVDATNRSDGPVYVRGTQSRQVAMLHERRGGTCGPTFQPGPAVVFDVAEVLDASAFMPLSITPVGTGRMVVDTLHADDGLIVPIRLRDTQYDVTCDLAQIEDTPGGPCIPREAVRVEFFADDRCVEPVVIGETSMPVATMGTFGCPRQFELGAPLAPAVRYQYAFGQCREDLSGMMAPAVGLGAAIDPAMLSRAVASSTTRAANVYVEHEGTRFREPNRFFDNAIGSECWFVPNGGDTWACMPPSATFGAFLYSDAACTVELPNLVSFDVSGQCGVHRPPTVVRAIDEAFLSIGPRYTGPVFQMNGASCDDQWFVPFYELGAPLGVSTMITTKRRDP